MIPVVLAGCGPAAPVSPAVAVGSIVVIGRTPLDVLISAVTGRDCSIVHWDAGGRYCHAKENPPEEPVYCTRSLGVPDCWAYPGTVPNRPRGLADGPVGLTPAQERDRTKGWLF